MQCVLCVNYKYYISGKTTALPVGASAFIQQTENILSKNRKLFAIMLYKRTPGIEEVFFIFSHYTNNGVPVFIFNFNFKKDPIIVKQKIYSFLTDLNILRQNIFIYYHTDTLASYHPKKFLGVITHHGPFVDDFIERYSLEAATQAFGSLEKVKHLMHHQKLGLKKLKEDNFFIFSHSNLQTNIIENKGISFNKIFTLSPLIKLADDEIHDHTKVFNNIYYIIEKNKGIKKRLLFTAVSRLDYFKNINLFIETAIKAIVQNITTHAIIIGNAPDTKLKNLLSLIPNNLLNRFTFCCATVNLPKVRQFKTGINLLFCSK